MAVTHPKEVWKSFKIKENEALHWKVGAALIVASRLHNDWIVKNSASEETNEVEIERYPSEESLEGSFERWAFNSSKNTISFQPTLPDRPLVVRPVHKLGISPNSEIQFYINIPAWVSITIGNDKNASPLANIASETLSNTWFGDTFHGTFCYANKSYVRREKKTLEVIPNQIICPFKIINRGKESLFVERICLRMNGLSIFTGKERLWTNAVTAVFRGHGKDTQIEYGRKAPDDANDPELITPAAEKPDKNFLRNPFIHNPFPRLKEQV